MMFSNIVGLSTMIACGCRFSCDIMIWLMQSTNQMWSIGISRTSRALMMLWLGIVDVTQTTSRSFFIANRSIIPWMASKYCSDFRRMAIADDSGRARSFSETSAVTLISPTAGHTPALQQGHQQHAGRRQVEDVLRAAVRRAAHLHDLQGAEEVAASFQIARHDHAVREGLFDPPLGIPFLGRTDLGHEQGRAPFRAQHGPQAEQEVPDPLLFSDPIADGGHGVEDEAFDLLLFHEARDRVREEPRLVQVQVLPVDA